jgi:hypothetical protein
MVEAITFAKLFVTKGLGNSFGKYPLASRAGNEPVRIIRGIKTIATVIPSQVSEPRPNIFDGLARSFDIALKTSPLLDATVLRSMFNFDVDDILR